MKLAWIASGSDISPAANYDKDDGDDSAHASDPLDEVGNHSFWADALAGDATISEATVANQGDTDGAKDSVSRNTDGKTDESMSQGLFAGGSFARVTGGEHIEIATIDNIPDDKVSGDDRNVGQDI